MARFEDFTSDAEVQDIMERIVDKFPAVFDSFDTSGIHFIRTETTKEKKGPAVKLRSVTYPMEVFVGKPYIVETFSKNWEKLNSKQRNLAVFHVMCAIPIGGFDPESNKYAKKSKPDYEMYRLEFAVAGGIPDWQENDAANDPLDIGQDEVLEDSEGSTKHPVTFESIAEA